MTTPSSSHPYLVRETEQFDAEWRRALRLGYINPMVDPASLLQIREWVAQNPYFMPQWPNFPANVRWVGLNPGVQIRYSIIEDDRTVRLESVRIIELD